MTGLLRRFGPLALLLPALLFVAVVVTEPAANFHVELAFAGTTARFLHAQHGVSVHDATRTLALDTLFVVSWLVVVPYLLQRAGECWAPPHRQDGFWPRLWLAAVLAGVLDLAENALTLVCYRQSQPSGAGLVALAAVSWWKWAAYVGALIGVLFLVVGPWLGRPVRRALRFVFRVFDLQRRPDDADVPAPPTRDPGGIGICVSGGGIRAATVALGALRALDTPTTDGQSSWFRRARWITAVSGGAYTASGWLIARRSGSVVLPAPTQARDGLFDADGNWAKSVARRRRYLDNGHGSFTGGMAGIVLRSVFMLGTLTAVVVLVGCVVGRIVGSWAVFPWFPFTARGGHDELGLSDFLPARLVVPCVVPVALGLLAIVVSGLRRDDRWRSSWKALGGGLLALGVGLGVLLLGVPVAMRFFTTVIQKIGQPADAAATTDSHAQQTGSANWGLTVIAVLSALGITAALVRALVSSVKRRALRLGGVLLALLGLLFAGKVASDVARINDGNGGVRTFGHDYYALIALGMLVVYECVAAHRQTLNGLYRKRLAGTFALRNGDAVPLPPLGYSHEHTWPAYGSVDGPELVVCATAHARKRQVSGLPAMGFTFQPGGVTLYGRDAWRQSFVGPDPYPIGSWWEGFPRSWNVTRSASITGAAFASAMGRQGLGTTQALLVAFNLRLGCWVPNPRCKDAFADPDEQPRVGIGYLGKELFRLYNPERDPFVYVADGGHRENLGLVEMLRMQPSQVFVVDSSGDTPGLFTTLHEAIELAELELGIKIEFDLTPVLPPAGDPKSLPADCAVRGTVVYADGSRAPIFYGRYQLYEGSSRELRNFAAENAKFPNYSTSDQFLTADEFDMLVALGVQVGTRLGELASSPPSPK